MAYLLLEQAIRGREISAGNGGGDGEGEEGSDSAYGEHERGPPKGSIRIGASQSHLIGLHRARSFRSPQGKGTLDDGGAREAPELSSARPFGTEGDRAPISASFSDKSVTAEDGFPPVLRRIKRNVLPE
jgi:hypothetical protein